MVFRSSLPTGAFLPLVLVQLVGACADELNQKERRGASSVGCLLKKLRTSVRSIVRLKARVVREVEVLFRYTLSDL